MKRSMIQHPKSGGSSSTGASPSQPDLVEEYVEGQEGENNSNDDIDNAEEEIEVLGDGVSDLASESSTGGKRSWVWDHFKVYEVKKKVKTRDDKTGKMIEVDEVKKRAKCIYCPVKNKLGDYAADGGKMGTSGMSRHIKLYCKYYPPNQNKIQKILTDDKGKSNMMVGRGFSQSTVMEACVKMIVIDELPFSHVENVGFRGFCSVACPMFQVPSRRTIVRNFLQMYDDNKASLKNELSVYRVSLTTDTWTSLQNINYMVLTAHFIDWKMHKRILNFCVIPNHQGTTIGRLIEGCLLDWGIEKVLTITVDNASANKVAIDWVREKLNRWGNSQAVLGGKYLHVRCCAHIINLIVSSGLKKLSKSILAIRNAVRFVRSSSNRLDYFKSCAEKEKLSSKGIVCLDVPTRWNSTFLMLEAALRFQKTFVRMEEEDNSPFLAFFKEPDEEFDEEGNVVQSSSKKIRVGPPSKVDWDNAFVFVKFLRVFYDVTLRFSASLHPVAHTSFHDVLKIEHEIDRLFVAPEMATGSDAEKILVDMAANMRTKYKRYFGSSNTLNQMLMIALVLDPRFKMRHITHLLRKEKFDEEDVQEKFKSLKGILVALYDEYGPSVDGGIHMKKSEPQTSSSMVVCQDSGRDEILDDWMRVVEESDDVVVSHEVDQYFVDPLERAIKDKFDILLWWKLMGPKYPVLAAIARDVLAIQVSTVASESSFSTGGRVIDAFRSSLTPTTVEGLICMQNWLKGDDIAISELEFRPDNEELEFYESIEADYRSSVLDIKEKVKN